VRLTPKIIPLAPGRPQRRTLIVVFVTILIDFIGFSVLIPVLPLFADRLGATPFQVTLILSLYALAQLLFLPAWGWVSDRVGRRPVLLVSLLGTAVAFLLLAWARDIQSLYMARILAGVFAASIGTAQAVVTDVTTPAGRAEGMGLIGAAFGAGMIVGPMLGGLLASLFQEQAPFYAVAILATVNWVLTLAWLPESRPEGLVQPPWRDLAHSLVPTPLRLVLRVHDRRIAIYLLIFFVMFSSFAVLESIVVLYIGRRFGADELDAAILFAWIGIFLAVTQGVLVRQIVPLLGEEFLVRIGFGLMAIGIMGIAAAPSMHWLFLIGPVIAVGNGVAFPAFTSLFSKACRAEEAGELMGQSQSMATAGRIVGALVGGLLMEEALGMPFYVAGVAMATALVLFVALRHTLLGVPEAPEGPARAGPGAPGPGASREG
jgi:multidrug resistance protein